MKKQPAQAPQAATYLTFDDLDAMRKTVQDIERSQHMLACMLRSKAEVLTRACDNENDNGIYQIEGLAYLMGLIATHAEDIQTDIGKVHVCLFTVCDRAEDAERARDRAEDAEDAARAQAEVAEQAYERARADLQREQGAAVD